MGILLAFAPFIMFAVIDRLIGPLPGLAAGAAVSIALLLRDLFTAGRSPKILEIGTAILFSGLAIYAIVGGTSGSIFAVRLRVDAGLLAVVLLSMAVRRPFTLQYARERVGSDVWDSPRFLRTNYVITAVWAAAFAVMAAIDCVMVYDPAVPQKVGVVITVLTLLSAIKFTSWYPEKVSAEVLKSDGDTSLVSKHSS